MSGDNIVGMIASGSLCLLVLSMGILLLKGKGAFLIAGYNTMTKEEKEKYDEKALCRFVGWLMIAIFFCAMIIYAGVVLIITWLMICGIALIFILCIAAIIYVNTGNRFRKKI